MRAAEVAIVEQDERSGEMVALLNMIIYARAIAHDLHLSNSEFILSNAVDDLSNHLAKNLGTELSAIDVASLVHGRVGNC